MDNLIVFTHIKKTSGSSFLEELIKPNIPSEQCYHYGKLSNFILDMGRNNYKFVSGHVPYGVHLFTNRKVRYITFLRNPIDRSISQYYYWKLTKPNKKSDNPRGWYANSLSLKEFYRLPRFHNYQTRFISGIVTHKLYPTLASLTLKRMILQKAINNLFIRKDSCSTNKKIFFFR